MMMDSINVAERRIRELEAQQQKQAAGLAGSEKA